MPTVLITGASRGIGHASAVWLAARGWDVLAGVRDPASAPTAAGAGTITPVRLDITDREQVGALEATLPAHVDAVVNNAGIVVAGPVEAVGPDELRRQFEVNVIGQAAVTQAVLPRLRAARGRVVFVSSVSGRIATPMFGPYSASKFALEAMADALRMEVAPWGIRVALVEPAQTDTDMWLHAEDELDIDGRRARSGAPKPLCAPHRGLSPHDPALDEVGLPGRWRRRGDRARAHRSPPARPLRGRPRGADPGTAGWARADAAAGPGAVAGDRRAAPA